MMNIGFDITTILNYYGITQEGIRAWGGKIGVSMDEALKGNFDLVAGFLASPALNSESSSWTTLSQKFDLYFLELPEKYYREAGYIK
jgi:hypothetical protein